MKKLMTMVGVVVLAASMSVAAFAQDAGPRQGGPGVRGGGQQGQPGGMRLMRMNEEIMAKLNLTQDQKNRIQALNKKTQEQLRALRPQRQQGTTPPTPEQRRQMGERMRPIMEQHRQQLMAILTPAQRQQYEKLVREQMEKMRRDRGQRPGGPGAPGAPGAQGGAKPGGKKGGGL